MTKQNYLILWHAEADKLAQDVSKAIDNGYILAGSAYHNGHVHYQPLVLLELSTEMRAMNMMGISQ
jgi:hypothetical protein